MNKFVAKMRGLEGAVKDRYDVWAEDNLVRSSSPSVNWMFGKNHGIPLGYTTLSWGEQKAGKSVLFYDLTGQIHQKWPDAIVIKFDTEFRDDGQLDEDHARAYGIDLDRFVVFQTNRPEGVFDVMNTDIMAMIQQGANVKYIGIDSLSMLMGRLTADAKSIGEFTFGDHARTMQLGLGSIRGMLWKHKIGLYLTAHARDEMDRIEQMRGNKKRPQAANAVKHLCEFIINVERNNTKDGNKDELGETLTDQSKTDMVDDAERTGHKMKFWMQGSTLGPANRVAQATFDYTRGFVNQHEEVFNIGKNWGVIQRPNAQTYRIGGEDFRGKPAILTALAERKDLQQSIMRQVLDLEKTIGLTTINETEAVKAFDNLGKEEDVNSSPEA